MDEGFLFWLIIFAVAILQGVGQRKKKPGQPGGKPGSRTAPRQQAPRPVEASGASRDPASVPPVGTTAGGRNKTSEGLIPADVWEEILGLARGQPPARREAPQEEVERAAEEVRGFEEGRSYDDEGRGDERDAGPGRWPKPAKPHRPAKAARKPLPATRTSQVPQTSPWKSWLARPEGEQAGRAGGEGARQGSISQELFGSGSAEELRKAVILKEVLGPPVALRDD